MKNEELVAQAQNSSFLIPHSSLSAAPIKRSAPYLCTMPVSRSLCYYYPAYCVPSRCEAALTWPG